MSERICLCGCGASLAGLRADAVYASEACSKRARRAASPDKGRTGRKTDTDKLVELLLQNPSGVHTHDLRRRGISGNPSQRATDAEEKYGIKIERTRESRNGRPGSRFTLIGEAEEPQVDPWEPRGSSPPYTVDPETGCWVWSRTICENGYGQIYVRRGGKKKKLRAHRVYYEQSIGPIPDGLHIDHLCRNRACVNPDHLEAVTQRENNRRVPVVKLTLEKAREILSSDDSTRVLAEKYGVSLSTIYEIRAGRRWPDARPAESEPLSLLPETPYERMCDEAA